MAETLFVQDGQTFTGNVPRFPGVHPAVQIKYRPAVNADRVEYNTAPPFEKAEVAARIISRQVQTIRAMKDGVPDGEGYRVDVPQAMKLHAALSGAVLDLVLGFAGPAAESEKNSPLPPASPSSPPETTGPAGSV
jgi:hypothetical protein